MRRTPDFPEYSTALRARGVPLPATLDSIHLVSHKTLPLFAIIRHAIHQTQRCASEILVVSTHKIKYVTELELIAALEDAGIHVVFLPWPLPGAYWHAQRLIIVDARLSPTWQRSTLAHEGVHAWYGHDGPCELAREAWVDEHAAGLLVSEAEYRLAERIHGNDVHGIADELDVTDWIVEAYRRRLANAA